MKMMVWTKLGWGALLLAGTCGMALVAPAQAAGPKGGELWEITTSMEMPGMPFAIPPTTVRQCIADNAGPYQAQEGEKCDTVTQSLSGNTLTWQVKCSGTQGKMELAGVSTYVGDTMDSKVKMKSENGDMSLHVTGKKLGACK